MVTWLLNPKNLIIVGLSIALIAVTGLWQWQRIRAGNMQNTIDALGVQIASLEIKIDTLKEQIATRDTVIENLKKNLDSVRVSAEEMQKVDEKTTALRKKIKKLEAQQVKPYDSSGKLEAEYAKVAADITGLFNAGVRLKVKAPRGDNGKAATEVLPSAGETGTEKPGDGK